MKANQSGMTLLEVLLAMAIFTVAAMALISSLSGQIKATSLIEEQVFASWVADNQLKEVYLLQLTQPKVKIPSSGSSKMGTQSWPWKMDAINDEALQAVKHVIQVTTNNGQTVEMTSYTATSQESDHDLPE